jgi:ABC-type spermidine/putrescine transport system permease subunit I
VTDAAAESAAPGRRRSPLVPVALFAPCALVYAVFFIWPQASLLAISTSDKAGFTLHHYGRFFSVGYYWEMLGRTLGMGFAVTLITLVLGLPTAYVLARAQSRWAGFLLLLTTFPLLISAVVR